VEVAQLRDSRKRLVLDADAERRRIERDLHDGVQQHLVALAVTLQLASEAVQDDPRAARALLLDVARDVQETIDEAARLALRIHPPRLDSNSLRAALRSWAVSAGVRATIEVRLSMDYPSEAAETVYFCCVDALGHVSAGAHVTITVQADDGIVAFDVVDDGAHVPPTSSGVGLDRLRDRLDALGGELAVEPEPGGGTRVSGSIPLSLRG
jgi:signal transduction histidine kinase